MELKFDSTSDPVREMTRGKPRWRQSPTTTLWTREKRPVEIGAAKSRFDLHIFPNVIHHTVQRTKCTRREGTRRPANAKRKAWVKRATRRSEVSLNGGPKKKAKGEVGGRRKSLRTYPCESSRDKPVLTLGDPGWRGQRRNCPRHPPGITSTVRSG